jgi:hypothetical protein
MKNCVAILPTFGSLWNINSWILFLESVINTELYYAYSRSLASLSPASAGNPSAIIAGSM